MFDGVQAWKANLDGINPSVRACPPIVLFGPISLQTGDVNILCRSLSNRLQRQINGLVDADRSSFITGCSIFENFVYASEMMQCCHKRATPTLVMKLHFAKAFDSMNWCSLGKIMEAYGFPHQVVRLDGCHLLLIAVRTSLTMFQGSGLPFKRSSKVIPSPCTSSSLWWTCCNR